VLDFFAPLLFPFLLKSSVLVLSKCAYANYLHIQSSRSRVIAVRSSCLHSASAYSLITDWYSNADKRKLPLWRYSLRQRLLPLIRWETPYLAWMQDKMRSPALDSYFATTANLGTHTFFMVVLPILFWCGHTSLGRG
jgi:hypothetical protein